MAAVRVVAGSRRPPSRVAACCAGSARVHQMVLPPAPPAAPPRRWPPVHDLQTQPTVGPVLGRQHPPQIWVLVVHGHLQPRPPPLQPQLQGRPGMDPGVGTQLAGHQRRRLGQLPKPPAATHLPHERPASPGRGRGRPQGQPLPQPGRSAAGIGQRLIQGGIDRQMPGHPELEQGGGDRRPDRAQHQGRARPSQGGMADGGEHPGAQRVHRLHLAKVADERRRMLGQLLEDGPLQLGGGGHIQPTGQSQHHTAPAADCWIRIGAFHRQGAVIVDRAVSGDIGSWPSIHPTFPGASGPLDPPWQGPLAGEQSTGWPRRCGSSTLPGS
jgi:hypothetical protein